MRHKIWMYLGRSSILYNAFYIIQKIKKGIRAVDKNTLLLIDGYPRSANTFFFSAFTLNNPEFPKHRIAHHIHSPVQFIKAARLSIPAVLLIREPKKAVASLLIREGDIDIEFAIKNYIAFYELLLPYKEDLIIADFEEVINDFTKVILKLNSRYGLSYNAELNSSINKRIRENVKKMDIADTGGKSVDQDKVGLPSPEKENLKRNIYDRMDKGRINKLLGRASLTYDQFKDSGNGI